LPFSNFLRFNKKTGLSRHPGNPSHAGWSGLIPTGNQQRMQVASVNQLLLVVYIFILPYASTLDEMTTFIYNEGAGGLYSSNKVLSK
jgi:hypothetical protein